MDKQELIDRLKRDIEDWNEQAHLWDLKGDADLASQCRTKAEQWADVIRYLEKKERT